MSTQEELKTATAPDAQKSDSFLKRNKVWLGVIIILLALLAIMYAWSTMSISQIRKAMVAQQQGLEEQAQQQLEANTEELLLLSTQGFTWAVRGEFLRGNEEQVQQYFSQLVKNKRVERAEFIDQTGLINLSSDKKREGQPFKQEEYGVNPLKQETLHYHADSTEQVRLFAPVMGLERRLGTLMILYTPSHFNLQEEKN